MTFKLALLFSAAAVMAAAPDSVVEKKQNSLLQQLQNLQESNSMGVSLNGTAKGGALSSSITSDQLDATSPSRETGAFSDVKLQIGARPTAESRALVEMRLHQDWQTGHAQGVNPLNVSWWSYDGRSFGKKLSFNLGHMRVGYSPLTLNVPSAENLQEPEIFANRRREAMADRNLDGSSKRLLQGLNADFHSGEALGLSDLQVQGTMARVRNVAKKVNQVFFDFDKSDRYLLGGRFGASFMGSRLGLNYTNVFDRISSTHAVGVSSGDTIDYESNQVYSLELSLNSDSMGWELPFSMGLNGEYAQSNWAWDRDVATVVKKSQYVQVRDLYVRPDGVIDSAIFIVEKTSKSTTEITQDRIAELDGTGMLLQPYFKWALESVKFDMQFDYLKNEENFYSEMACSPAYLGNTAVLNSDAMYTHSMEAGIAMVRSGSLENMYYSLYRSEALTQMTAMGNGNPLGELPAAEDHELYNNYYMGHFIRNGYTSTTYTRSELALVEAALDPSVGLALPFGYATPNRKGFGGRLNAEIMKDVTFNGRYYSVSLDKGSNKFTEVAAGLGVELGDMLDLSRRILVQGSYTGGTESEVYKRETKRIMAGGSFEVWKGINLLVGYQTLEKTFGSPWYNVTKVQESLVLAGPQVRLGAGSVLTLQYGILGNEVSYLSETDGSAQTLSIDKNLMSADISVQF